MKRRRKKKKRKLVASSRPSRGRIWQVRVSW
jgi:hypothetical protein